MFSEVGCRVGRGLGCEGVRVLEVWGLGVRVLGCRV